jgi:Ulp1 family protease
MDPSVVSYLQLQCSLEEQLEYKQNFNSNIDYLCIPINDNLSFQELSTHWSLLVLDFTNLNCFHFDSMSNRNHIAATTIATTILTILSQHQIINVLSNNKIITVKSPQQNNSHDCGIHTLLTASLVSAELYNNQGKRLHERISYIEGLLESEINHTTVRNYRASLKVSILSLPVFES